MKKIIILILLVGFQLNGQAGAIKKGLKYSDEVVSIIKKNFGKVIKEGTKKADNTIVKAIEKASKGKISPRAARSLVNAGRTHGATKVTMFYKKYGNSGVIALENYGDDLIKNAHKFDDNAIKYISVQGKRGSKAVKKLGPDLVNKTLIKHGDNGIKKLNKLSPKQLSKIKRSIKENPNGASSLIDDAIKKTPKFSKWVKRMALGTVAFVAYEFWVDDEPEAEPESEPGSGGVSNGKDGENDGTDEDKGLENSKAGKIVGSIILPIVILSLIYYFRKKKKDLIKNKQIITSICLVLVVGLFSFDNLKFPYIDEQADSYFKETGEKTLVTYASVRIINASVSVIKDSDVELNPAGIGASISAGQLLDPLEDMTERLSDLLVLSIASLGVQKLIYEISLPIFSIVLGILLILLIVNLWVENSFLKEKYIKSSLVILFMARLLLPVSAVLNTGIEKIYFNPAHDELQIELEIITSGVEFADDRIFNTDGDGGLLTSMSSTYEEVKEKALYYFSQLDDIVLYLVKFTTLYLGMLVIQILLIPLSVFWIMKKVYKEIIEPRYDQLKRAV